MDVLAEYSLDQFIRQAVAELEKSAPERLKDLGHEHLPEFVVEMLEKAETFGIDTEEEVLTYIRFAARFGRDFDTRHDWARVLRDPDLDAEDKIALLEKNAPADEAGS